MLAAAGAGEGRDGARSGRRRLYWLVGMVAVVAVGVLLSEADSPASGPRETQLPSRRL